MADRSLLLASNYNTWPEAFNGQSYAFLNVINQIESADIVVPPAGRYAEGRGVRPNFSYLGGEFYYRSKLVLGRALGKPAGSPMKPFPIEKDYDLFVYMCQFPVELSALKRLRGWRKRSKVAIAYILETWAHLLEPARAELGLLDEFDFVFVLNGSSVESLKRYTSTPCRFLATASDCMLSTPFPVPPKRSIDVYSMGRRSPRMHDQLKTVAQQSRDFTYVFDTIRHGVIPDWSDHRFLTAEMIKRSKYFIAYDHRVVDVGAHKNFAEQSLSTRYFEGAAGGAVLLGNHPSLPEFSKYFDWEDAVVDLPESTEDIHRFLQDLGAQTDRLEIARKTAAIESLRRHDWAHRWSSVLEELYLVPTEDHKARLQRLDQLAAEAQAGSVVSLAQSSKAH